MDTFQKELSVTNRRFTLFGRKQRDNRKMEQVFRESSDLEDCKKLIVRDIFSFNVKNGEVKNQLCMETLNPEDALHFGIVIEREREREREIEREKEREANSCIRKLAEDSRNLK